MSSTGATADGFDRQFGARPLRRTVQRRIENPLARRILAGDFAEGDVVEVDFADDEFTFRKADRTPEREREAVTAAV